MVPIIVLLGNIVYIYIYEYVLTRAPYMLSIVAKFPKLILSTKKLLARNYLVALEYTDERPVDEHTHVLLTHLLVYLTHT